MPFCTSRVFFLLSKCGSIKPGQKGETAAASILNMVKAAKKTVPENWYLRVAASAWKTRIGVYKPHKTYDGSGVERCSGLLKFFLKCRHFSDDNNSQHFLQATWQSAYRQVHVLYHRKQLFLKAPTARLASSQTGTKLPQRFWQFNTSFPTWQGWKRQSVPKEFDTYSLRFRRHRTDIPNTDIGKSANLHETFFHHPAILEWKFNFSPFKKHLQHDILSPWYIRRAYIGK